MSLARKPGLLSNFWAMLRETFGDAPRPVTVPVPSSQAVIAAAARQILSAGPRPVSALAPIEAGAPAVATPVVAVQVAEAARITNTKRNLAGRIRANARLNVPASRSRLVVARAVRSMEKKVARKKTVARHVWLEARKVPVAAAKPQLRLVADNSRREQITWTSPSRAA